LLVVSARCRYVIIAGVERVETVTRKVVIVAFPGVQTLDVAGPAEVFSLAGRIASARYDVVVASSRADALRTSSGISLAPAHTLRGVRGAIDTLLVAGGTGVAQAERDETLIRWLRAAAGRSRRVASVCTGALLLARAGLLDGRRATTHWAACAELARRYPATDVAHDAIFVRDGNVWSSAGVSAGMDLALALVEEDVGREVALEVARWLVLFVRRPGGQSQFSIQLAAQTAERPRARAAGLDRRASRSRPVGRGARRAGLHERPQLRTRLSARGRDAAGRLRADDPRRARPA
jgi:transcriptional regulator GlxA family with amidase domain